MKKESQRIVLFFAIVVSTSQFNRSLSATPEKKTTIPTRQESQVAGRIVFLQNCVACHGENGKAEVNVMSSAADLTSPETWKFGRSDADIFRTISKGAGMSMPPFKGQLESEQILNLVQFIKSLWSNQPKRKDQDP